MAKRVGAYPTWVKATEPFGAGADQCLLFPASDQIADKSRMTKRANNGNWPAIT